MEEATASIFSGVLETRIKVFGRCEANATAVPSPTLSGETPVIRTNNWRRSVYADILSETSLGHYHFSPVSVLRRS